MKSVSVVLESLKKKNELSLIRVKKELIPPWRVRFRRRALKLARVFIEPARIVRLVGPNTRPLERHQFENSRALYDRNRIL